MTDFFRQQGRALLANGYLIVPIRPGAKAPALAAWQNARLGAADLSNYPSHGVGVICGSGAHPVAAIDIDVSHPAINAALVTWCRKYLGDAPERVGAAPRIILVYRAAEAGWTKGNSTSFLDPADPVKPNGKENVQRIEVLGLGQQFVAYHVHPDTQQPYEWVDWQGGLAAVAASQLPVITDTQVRELMDELDRLVRASGLEVRQVGEATRIDGGTTDDWLAGMVPPTGTSIEATKDLLRAYPNIDLDYDTWTRVGMALWHEYSGSPEALKVWMQWSASSKKYDPRDMHYKWGSFEPSPGKVPTTLRWLIKVSNEAKRDAEAAGMREAIDAIKITIARATDAVRMTSTLAREISPKIPDDLGARAEVYKAFADKFKALSGTSLTLSAIKEALLPKKVAKAPTVRAKRPLTEFGNVMRLLDRYGAGMMYVPELDAWHLWTGVYWRRAHEIEIQHYAKESIKAMINEADEHDGAAEFFDWCKTSQSYRMVVAVVKSASSEPQIMVPAKELDKYPHLLGVRNGVVDLRTGALIPADPEYRITNVAGCDYVPGANAPLFVQTLIDVFSGDEEMMRFFHRLIGYTLSGDPTQDVMVIPWGNGSNGKSTVLNTIQTAFGTYGRTSMADSFVSAQGGGGMSGGGPREDLVRLTNARFVYASEPEENSELRESAVKSMAGGDKINARAMFARVSIEITPTWVVWMPTNHKPIIKGNDNGIWRRIVLLPFLRNFEEVATKDALRQEKLAAELPGVLAWCIQGALRYTRDGLLPPATVREARDEYRNQMDILADWLEECCEVAPGLEESATALWISWEAWAKRNGAANYVRSAMSLGKRLENRFPSKKGTGGKRFRYGIRVKTDLSSFSEVKVQ